MMYEVTGVLVNGRRFKKVVTNNLRHACGINLYRGSIWKREGEHRKLLYRVWN